MKRDVNPVNLISKKEKAKTVNTLLKVKFQAKAIHLPASPKSNVPYAPIPGNFH